MGSPLVEALTLTVVIPAHNEETCLEATLEALLKQTVPPERIVVFDDGSTDATAAIARCYPVELVQNPVASGTKSRALNHVLPTCDTDVVMNLDADTMLAPNFVERIKAPFADPKVAVAAGMVQVWNPHGFVQRSRQIEYLMGQHFFRATQNQWSSPTVCPGCACAFRQEALDVSGGLPDGTIAEDMDFTWRAMIKGYRAVYVADAECYVVDPHTPRQLKTQLWRWMSGYFQCVRLHWKEIIRAKRLLALLVIATIWDIFTLPILLASPFALWALFGISLLKSLLVAWLGTDLVVTLPVVMYGGVRRGWNPLWMLINGPLIWVNKPFVFWYAAKAALTELVLVPLGWKKSLATFLKGH
ncbi:MAG TPA: glycosyltransferase family 2 protein [Streptosporangiaceae bacterium]|nr:glycosyltransferase family 2 protein [Streptosporangiaceae bacterium]